MSAGGLERRIVQMLCCDPNRPILEQFVKKECNIDFRYVATEFPILTEDGYGFLDIVGRNKKRDSIVLFECKPDSSLLARATEEVEYYKKDKTFEQSLRLDIERGINFTDTSKYGTRKLGVLYDSKALDWPVFSKKAKIAFSEVNNPIQLSGQAKRSKYIEDQLKMGCEVLIIDTTTNRQILKFDPFPDNQKDISEYRRRIRESLEKANKLIADGVAKAKTTGKFGVQVVIRPVKGRRLRPRSKQKKLDGF